MTEQEFKKLQDLSNSIQEIERKLIIINTLIECRDLSCKITGTPMGSQFRKVTREISFSDKQPIIEMLKTNKSLLEDQLLMLKQMFNSL